MFFVALVPTAIVYTKASSDGELWMNRDCQQANKLSNPAFQKELQGTILRDREECKAMSETKVVVDELQHEDDSMGL